MLPGYPVYPVPGYPGNAPHTGEARGERGRIESLTHTKKVYRAGAIVFALLTI